MFVFVIYLICLGLHFLSLFTLGANKKRKKVPKKEKNQLVFQNSSSSLCPVRALFAKQTKNFNNQRNTYVFKNPCI